LLQEVASNPQQLISELTRSIEGRKRAASNSNGTNAGREAGTAYVAPRNSVEEAIARMWCEALGLERVGINHNFFELGGRPLAATQILHRMRNVLQVSLPLPTFFETPTVAALSEAVLAREETPGRAEKIARIMNKIERMSAEDMKIAIHDKERQKGSHEGNEPAPR
jgi:7-cyano-7-deazaguanine synthase in queuosine biosynthesis